MVLRGVFQFWVVVLLLLCSTMAYGQNNTVVDSLLRRGYYELDNISPKLDSLFDQGRKHSTADSVLLAEESFIQYISTLKEHLSTMFMLLSDDDKEIYWSHYINKVTHIQKYGLIYSSFYPALSALAYDCQLLIKGLLFESSSRLKRAILDSKDKDYVDLMYAAQEMKHLYAQMRGYYDVLESDSTYVAALKVARQGGSHQLSKEIEKAEKGYKTMNELTEKIIEFEEEMSLQTSLHATPLQSLSVSWRDVQNALSENQAAIEFVPCITSIDLSATIYYAIVIRKGLKEPIVATLLTEERLAQTLNASEPNFEYLFEKLWKPIDWHLKGIDELYLATSGLLNGVPFAALQYKGDYLTDYYNIHNVLSTRDVISLKQQARDSGLVADNSLFIGGADFGVSPSNGENQADLYRGQGFDYLPQSKKEVEVSAELLSKVGWETALYTDIEASKENLIRYVSLNSPSLLHIATHGFYYPKPSEDVSELKMVDIGSVAKSQYVFSQNPLMRCGLLFSGANHTWSNKEPTDGADNGILTGVELSGLNLSRTELAIVSACHTAMGDVDYAEGVRGIQRALRMAGAKKTIAALWAIPDRESAEFMREFYTFLRVSRNIATSFLHAQKYMRQKYATDLKKWAGFVLIE